MPELNPTRTLSRLLDGIAPFSTLLLGRPLRAYQLPAARAILSSVRAGRGDLFLVCMARQAGKNELSAQIEAYLLNRHAGRGGQIVKASPTFKPQTINSMMRLQLLLDNPLNRADARSRYGYQVELGRARALFFSAGSRASVVGATADLLLEADEAQDIAPWKWQRDFVPMGAASNVTSVFYGTPWTRDTLLAQVRDHCLELERRDGRRRVYLHDADEVAAEVPGYGAYVKAQVQRLGRQHPLVRTQFFLEEIDVAGRLFTAGRQKMMQGQHERLEGPGDGAAYALLLDISGEDEVEGDAQVRLQLANPRRDATALTVVEVEQAGTGLPRYRAVDRRLWLGAKHSALCQEIVALFARWRASRLVLDATGVGAGLASFLARELPGKVVPVIYSPAEKSRIGWEFLGAVESGRYLDYLPDGKSDTRQFWYEVDRCNYEVVPGPAHRLRWGVWEPPSYNGLVAAGHDDLLNSASLCVLLDAQFPAVGQSAVVQTSDPLAGPDERRW
jgi:hypothetical protein